MFRSVLRRLARDFSRLKVRNPQYPSASLEQIVVNRLLFVTPRYYSFEEQCNKFTDYPVSSTLGADTDDLVIDENLFAENESKNIGNKVISRQDALQVLSDELFIGQVNGEKIFEKETKLRYLNRANFLKVIDLIKKFKVSSNIVEEFPWILAIPSYHLSTKLETLVQMKPKKIDDFVPLLRVSNFRLLKIMCIMENEHEIIPGGNRIYYIAKKLEVAPTTICKYLSRRLFMLEIPAQSLVVSLETMLEYGISPSSIMRDLWAFRYNTESMRDRLERAKKANKTKLMPWMIRCPESILQRSLRIAVDEKKILGKYEDVYAYLSHRLGFDLETTKGIVAKHPAVAKIRLTKIKDILDFLLNEAGFTRHEIAQVPRILSHSLETTKRRLEELKSYGCRPSTLVIVCKSKREYQKFVDHWLQKRKQMKIE